MNTLNFIKHGCIKRTKLLNITDTEAKNAKIWLDFIWDEFNEKSIGDDILDELKQLLSDLKTLIFKYKNLFFELVNTN